MGDVQQKLVRANPVKQLWLGNKKQGTNLQVYICCLPVRDPEDAKMPTRTGRAERPTPGQILLWSDLQHGSRSAGCETSVSSHFLYKQSWSSFRWESMEFTSILAHNYEKISRPKRRSGSFPSAQAILAMGKSQLLHRSALGICEKGSKAKLQHKIWNTIREWVATSGTAAGREEHLFFKTQSVSHLFLMLL